MAAKKRKRVTMHIRCWDDEREECKERAWRKKLTLSQFGIDRMLPHAKHQRSK